MMSSFSDPSTRWAPGQYLKFEDHRLRPALELLQRIPDANPRHIIDLGCGTGQVTRILAERWPEAEITGLDSSHEMLQRAREVPSQVRWQEADIAQWRPEQSCDLIFSNAALHWVPGHEELFPRLLSYLETGGCLAVQMPLSWGMPSHRLMRETLANGDEDGSSLGSSELKREMDRKWVEEPGFYFDLFTASGTGADLWQTEYLQILEGEDPVFEWVQGAGLRPILNSLEGSTLARFVHEYKHRLRQAYPRRLDGRTLYPFRRQFLIARTP